MEKAVSVLLIAVLAVLCSACGQNQADRGTPNSALEPTSELSSQSPGVDAAESDAPGESKSVTEGEESANPLLSGSQATRDAGTDVEPAAAVEIQQETARESSPSLPESNPEISTTEEGIAVAGDTQAVLGNDGMYAVNITVGNEVFAAKFYDNESARVLIDQMPMTLDMRDYAGQEKVLALDYDFPPAARQTPPTIRAGDLYLYSGNSLVLFYTTFSNAYSYVPIGYLPDTGGLASALGNGNILVVFSAP